MAMITVSTILLAIDGPLNDPKSTQVAVLAYIDYVMTAIFTIEMVIKMIAVGLLLNGKKSYLRNTWNILDFVIVTSALFSIAFA